MFQHVTVLVSFIFAIALTHVFSSASQLILARERVRFSWLLSVSMLNAALGVIINWLGLWDLQLQTVVAHRSRASAGVGPELFQLAKTECST